jgi:hypothetical protein
MLGIRSWQLDRPRMLHRTVATPGRRRSRGTLWLRAIAVLSATRNDCDGRYGIEGVQIEELQRRGCGPKVRAATVYRTAHAPRLAQASLGQPRKRAQSARLVGNSISLHAQTGKDGPRRTRVAFPVCCDTTVDSTRTAKAVRCYTRCLSVLISQLPSNDYWSLCRYSDLVNRSRGIYGGSPALQTIRSAGSTYKPGCQR